MPVSAHPVTLTTRRLQLRPARPEDAEAIADIVRHREVAERVVSIPHPLPEDWTSGWFARLEPRVNLPHVHYWMLTGRDSGVVIGDCGVEVTTKHRRGSIGFLLHPARWGEGLMTEALLAVGSYLFEQIEPHLLRLEADHFPDNATSEGLLTKLGMQREGVLRSYVVAHGKPCDFVRRSVLRDEFLAVRAEYERSLHA